MSSSIFDAISPHLFSSFSPVVEAEFTVYNAVLKVPLGDHPVGKQFAKVTLSLETVEKGSRPTVFEAEVWDADDLELSELIYWSFQITGVDFAPKPAFKRKLSFEAPVLKRIKEDEMCRECWEGECRLAVTCMIDSLTGLCPCCFPIHTQSPGTIVCDVCRGNRCNSEQSVVCTLDSTTGLCNCCIEAGYFNCVEGGMTSECVRVDGKCRYCDYQ